MKTEPFAVIRLREFRDSFGVSQQAIADELGCTRAYIAFLEQGKRIPSLDVAYKLAAYFRVMVEDIWERSDG